MRKDSIKTENQQDSLKISPSKWNYTLKTQIGGIFKTNPYLKDLPGKSTFYGTAMQITKQTMGNENWHEAYGFPAIGFGVGYFNMLEQDHMNNPFIFYGVFSGSLMKGNKLDWRYEFDAGIAYKWRTFSQKENYLNYTFGAKSSVHFSLGTSVVYQLSKHFDIGVGVALNHFSNGGFREPNKGLNEYNVQMQFTYVPERAEPQPALYPQPLQLYKAIDIYAYYGFKNVMFYGEMEDLDRRYEGYFHDVLGWEGVYYWQQNRKSSWGLGAGLTYDGEYNHQMYLEGEELRERKRFRNPRVLLSVFPSYRLAIGEFKIHVDAGYYFFKTNFEEKDSKFFQRIGFSYPIYKNLFAGITLHAYSFHKADYVEFRVGYTIFKKKR